MSTPEFNVNTNSSTSAIDCNQNDWSLSNTSVAPKAHARMYGGQYAAPAPTVTEVESLEHPKDWAFTPRQEYMGVCGGKYNAMALYTYLLFRFYSKNAAPRATTAFNAAYYWVEPVENVAKQLKLTGDQVRYAADQLKRLGLIVAERHRYYAKGPIERYRDCTITYWRPVVAGGAAGLSDWPSTAAVQQTATTNANHSCMGKFPNVQLGKSPTVNHESITSLINNEETQTTPSPTASGIATVPEPLKSQQAESKTKPKSKPTPSPGSAAPLPGKAVKTSVAAPAVVARYLRFKLGFVEALRAAYAADAAAAPHKKLKPSALLEIQRSIDCITVDSMTLAEASALERLEHKLRKAGLDVLAVFDWLQQPQKPPAQQFSQWLKLGWSLNDSVRANVLWLLAHLQDILEAYTAAQPPAAAPVLPVVVGALGVSKPKPHLSFAEKMKASTALAMENQQAA